MRLSFANFYVFSWHCWINFNIFQVDLRIAMSSIFGAMKAQILFIDAKLHGKAVTNCIL